MSSKLTIKEALLRIDESESTLRRDIKSGKISSEKDEKGRRRIEVPELIRVYGELKPLPTDIDQPNASVNNSQMTTPDTAKTIALLEAQVDDLKTRLDAATAEKKQLLELFSQEKAEKRALMPPESDTEQKSGSWFDRLIAAIRT